MVRHGPPRTTPPSSRRRRVIYGVRAPQYRKPANTRRLHKRAGPVVLPLVRGPPRPARRPSALRELDTTIRSGGDLAPPRFRATFTPSSRRSPREVGTSTAYRTRTLLDDVQKRQTSAPSKRPNLSALESTVTPSARFAAILTPRPAQYCCLLHQGVNVPHLSPLDGGATASCSGVAARVLRGGRS